MNRIPPTVTPTVIEQRRSACRRHAAVRRTPASASMPVTRRRWTSVDSLRRFGGVEMGGGPHCGDLIDCRSGAGHPSYRLVWRALADADLAPMASSSCLWIEDRPPRAGSSFVRDGRWTTDQDRARHSDEHHHVRVRWARRCLSLLHSLRNQRGIPRCRRSSVHNGRQPDGRLASRCRRGHQLLRRANSSAVSVKPRPGRFSSSPAACSRRPSMAAAHSHAA